MMNSVVITGATGTIGLALIEECISRNIKVLAIVRRNSKNIGRIPNNKNVSILECCIDEYNDINVEGHFDAFIHLAWDATGGDEERNKAFPQAKNIEYSLDAVELASRLGCNVFVGSGSQAEYGRTDEVLTEATVPKPETAYGMAKLCAGQMTRLVCEQKGIRHIWPRILSTYGPGSQSQTVVNYTISELLKGNSPRLSAGDQMWDFIYVGDCAKALLALAERGTDGGVYVIGSGTTKKLKDYFKIMRDVVGEVANEEMPELRLGEIPYNDNTVMHLACDNSRLINDTGVRIDTDFETGIKKTIDWILKLN